MQPRARSPSTRRPGGTGRAARERAHLAAVHVEEQLGAPFHGGGVRGSEGPEVPRSRRRHRGRRSLKCKHRRGLKSHFRCKVPGAPCGENSPQIRERHRPAPSAMRPLAGLFGRGPAFLARGSGRLCCLFPRLLAGTAGPVGPVTPLRSSYSK